MRNPFRPAFGTMPDVGSRSRAAIKHMQALKTVGFTNVFGFLAFQVRFPACGRDGDEAIATNGINSTVFVVSTDELCIRLSHIIRSLC